MKAEHTRELSKGHSIEIGVSTWDDKERSIRSRYANATGGFSTGSPEVPMHDIEPMVTFAAEHDELSPADCTRIIVALAESIRRRVG